MDTKLGHGGATETLEPTIERRGQKQHTPRGPIWPFVAGAVAVLAVVGAILVVALDGGPSSPTAVVEWDAAKLEAIGKRQQAEPQIREALAQAAIPAGFVDGQVGAREGGTYAEPAGSAERLSDNQAALAENHVAPSLDNLVEAREGGTYAEPEAAGFVDGQVGAREGGTYATGGGQP